MNYIKIIGLVSIVYILSAKAGEEGERKAIQDFMHPPVERSLLAEAVQKNRTSGALQLIKNGANVNWQDAQGKTVLAFAVETHNLSVAQALIEAKAEVNGTDYIQGATLEAEHGDSNGFTTVMRAAQSGHVDMVQLLVTAGASVNRRSIVYDSALGIATRAGDAAMVQALLEAGATVDTSMVERATYDKHDDIVRMLASAPIWQKSLRLNARQAVQWPYVILVVYGGLVCAVVGHKVAGALL